MATSNSAFRQTDHPSAPTPSLLPRWLSNTNTTSTIRPTSPSVILTLSSSTAAASTPFPWLQPEITQDNTTTPTTTPFALGNILMPPHMSVPNCRENLLMSELAECCRELEEGHRAWSAHKKEAAWRLKRLELQLESEKAGRKREKVEEIEAKVEEIEAKVKALEQKLAMEQIETEYKEQIAGLRRDAEGKEQKLAEQWAAKHLRLTTFLEHTGCSRSMVASESNGR